MLERRTETPQKIEELNGVQKTAILLLYLGESAAAEILARLSESEILRVGHAMSTIESVPPELVEGVMREFVDRYSGQKGLTANGMDYLKRVAKSALGEDRARRLIRGVDTREQAAFQQKLARLNPESLAALMKAEHPQTAAVIASMLGLQTTSKVLTYFPAETRNDIIYRMASLERVPSEVMDHVREFIDREIQVPVQLDDPSGVKLPETPGVDRIAELLNSMGRKENEPIMQSLLERNPRLADEVLKKMFSFEDLLRVDDRGMQTLMRDVSKEDLAIALKMADDAIKEKFFRNMSERSAEFLRDDMEAMGPVRAKDVETAQRAVITVVMRLEEEGKIAVAPRD